ncbi:restriction endonuclease subunit S [Methylobacter sp. BBA5.1]|uniref:restriction endonuclease subunit S n=1 Tax=Methylobacter sp. BBA5.1 TaxID=1495064 RepID=UPI00055FBD74|nr:restriction endonuclease subunit S [Methylobacter sp. BBA5.1]
MELLEQHFDAAFAAPDGIKKLRELILTLAMQGRLVPQDPNDQPASELLKEIEAEKQRLVKEGKIKAPKPLPAIKPEEIHYELPQGWEWVRLGDICSYIQRGKGPKYADFSTHRVISQKCVRWYGLDLEPARYIDPASLKKYEPIRFLRFGDLLWNSTGTGTIGRACLVPQELECAEIVADSHVTVVRSIEVSPLFLWRWIQNPIVQNEIESSASGTTNQIELNTSTVINHLMPLPPLPEQRRIVAKIDQLMARCGELEKLRAERERLRLTVHAAALNRVLAYNGETSSDAWRFITRHFGELYAVKPNVAELRKAILQLAVMGKLVPQDPNDPPASELLKEIEAEKQRLVKEGKIKLPKPLSKIGNDEQEFVLPSGWVWSRLQDVLDVRDGTHDSPKDANGPNTYPLVTSKNFVNGKIDFSGARKISAQDHFEIIRRSRVEKYDILFSMIGGNIGNQVIVEDEREFSIKNVALFKYYNKDLTIPYFIKRFMEHLAIDLQAKAAGGAQPFVSLGFLRNLVIALPPVAEQHRIVAKIDQLMALCDTLERQIDAATGKRTELLNAVMAEV